ncbi:hypothetical protein BDZ97DRAFT_1665281 [Flammula alnicola]|nr:hypothetical protein BDZ97DRAFT_1665281 [Flammula alnicola]
MAIDNLRNLRQGWEKDGNSEAVKVVENILDALTVISWDQDLKGFGRNATDDVTKLASYMTKDWLTGEHANQMLELLKNDLELHEIPSMEIANTYFYEKIRDGFKQESNYTSDKSFRVYRHIGHLLATKDLDHLAFLANLSRTHWVGVVLDFREHIVWYGDSLGQEIPAEVKDVINWWTKFHSGRSFTYRKLPITIQKDFFSCCLLAWNAIAVFFSPDREDLIPADNVAFGRLQVLLRIIRKHESQTEVRNHLHREDSLN